MMQLTKKIEKEVLQVYDTWLHSYLNGDVATYDSYFDDDYHFIGSTDNEEFLSRKDTTNFFEKTADQLAGKCDLRKETRILEKFGDLVFITHVFDSWFFDGADYSYYGRFRFTNILHENKDGWRFIYQHFSTPDSKTEEGETIGFDRINAENQELREAIKRRTVELEQKNRELEIETALERIRAQVTSMEKSEDLLDIVVSMRKEFVRLGHEAHYFWHMRWHPDKYEKAMTSGDGARIGNVMELPRRIHAEIEALSEWEKSDEPTVIFTMNADAAIDYVDKMIEWGDFQRVDPNVPTDDDIRHIGGLTYVMARTSLGEIGYSLPGEVKNVPQTDLDILVRFARAFDLAHKRFEDLKKREQQTREMQIELALERVRSRTMAMYQTDELQEVIHILHKELLDLNISIEGGSFVVINKDVGTDLRLWGAGGTANTSEEVQVPHFDMPFCTDLINGIKRGPGFFTEEFSQQEKKDFFTKLFKHKPWSDLSTQQKKETLSSPGGYTRSVAVSKHTSILIINEYGRKFTEDENDILKRFAKVFEQTYTRFLDLQKAEAQAREAKIEAALERVRSRTMAMQRSEELPEAANNLFLQVQALGIPAWSAGYCIWENEDKKVATACMSSEGVIQKAFSLPTIGEGYNFYDPLLNDEAFHIAELGGEELVKHYEFMRTIPIVGEVLDGIIEAGFPLPAFQIFHIVYFPQGYLMFITYEPVPEAHDIFKRFAKVFEQTYTRFLDLQTKEEQAKKLLEEKQRLEKTLHDLRITQKQLIQSEKMASLGELTAGIAHEIQNPLNFVNNFSEVSMELLDEMKEEIENRDLDEAKAIAHDLKLNLKKINHHGQRADAIVKNMLLHSRKSSDEKTPTDINKLADEYLRLAYHGLRAKDKSFNATLHTDFDPTLEPLMVIPQEIGRVLLNLITNAFYTVQEKKKNNGADFQPAVTISTRKFTDHVTIAVKDNGNGIPQQDLDKIFQPFFTTKPTGEGTGLGLSLSYDIVKAHGGEIKVESEVNEGTVFTILLPDNENH